MSCISPNGVCYDLSRSPYTAQYKDFTFAFSTPRNKRKFEDNVMARVEWLEDSLTRRFHFHVSLPMLAAFQLYDQIEKRGFYVEMGGVPLCRESVVFAGLVVR